MKATKKTTTNKIKPIKEVKTTQIWNSKNVSMVKAHILEASKKQSPEQKLRNQVLAIQYQMQNYLEQDDMVNEMQLLDFVKLYLRILKMSQKSFAESLGMKDSNLHKYLTGERKLNPDLVMKLSSFSHTQPEMWYYIQTKNQLFELKKEKKKMHQYKKYDYEVLVQSL